MQSFTNVLSGVSVIGFAAALGALFLVLLPHATATAIVCHGLLLVAGCAAVLALQPER